MKMTVELKRFLFDKLLSSSRNIFRYLTILNLRKLIVKNIYYSRRCIYQYNEEDFSNKF